MKKNYLAALILVITSIQFSAQTSWTGSKITFTKANGANPSSEANQDRITDNVWITRGNAGGQIYNAKTESIDNKSTSPADTEWALGTISDGIGNLSFNNFRTTVRPKSAVGQNLVLHLITDDIYIDIKFLSWSQNRQGGFSYERSTDNSLNVESFNKDKNITIYPNPSDDLIIVSGLELKSSYKIFDILGKEIISGIAENSKPISIRNLNKGIYILKIENKKLKKFIKN